ncbi:MAG: peptide chain release factor 2 [Myxococcales bacterium]|nr:peptide chain release factor 2 [Myxococcales bacterium]MCB9520608.1 peptide chain release factor 2 [Myxococcales bacterium]MCB9531531.1 peptide chain release factor 2 [Myxococcales bacterium]
MEVVPYRTQLKSLSQRLGELRGIFDYDRLVDKLAELNVRTSAPGFWDDAEAAQKVVQERGVAEGRIRDFDSLGRNVSDIETLIELGEEMGEDEVKADLDALIEATSARLDEIEFRRMLSGEHDSAGAIVAINAGAGGTDSQDWAEMLLRMYLRYCERQGWKTQLVDRQDGEEAGIKSATFEVEGEYAFGFLKAESGVHRLVRISPFDSNARRQTSFSSVYVLPNVEDEIQVEINDVDLRIDTYRASGAGGQHVNRTDSAVRITHLPTGIVVQCQNERSQHKNRATAMKILKARLYEEERRKREEAMQAANNEKADIGWGSQIRSYVLHPYRMVKDLRTQHETSNPQAVLDGDLQAFVEAYLMKFGPGAERNEEDAPAY